MPEVNSEGGLPPRPQQPEPGDCCGGGCALCVFDLYERELERWKQAVADIERTREHTGTSTRQT